MLEIIATITLFIGLTGMAVIVFRKIPLLTSLSPEKNEGPGILNRVKDKIKNNGALKSFSGEILLQKVLSKIRILSLKADRQTYNWLIKLRQNAIEKKKKFSEDYWNKVKKAKYKVKKTK